MTFHSTLFLEGTFHTELFGEYGTTTTSASSRLREIIRNFEKQNPTKTVFTVGTAEPGLDNYECRLREAIKNLEKQS